MTELLIYAIAGLIVFAIGAAIEHASRPAPKDNVTRMDDWLGENSQRPSRMRW